MPDVFVNRPKILEWVTKSICGEKLSIATCCKETQTAERNRYQVVLTVKVWLWASLSHETNSSQNAPLTYFFSSTVLQQAIDSPAGMRSKISDPSGITYTILQQTTIIFYNLPPKFINPLTPELNPSAQRCLARYFTGDIASWTVHFVNICVKAQQMQQFINYVW
jgi:hypothetical protein